MMICVRPMLAILALTCGRSRAGTQTVPGGDRRVVSSVVVDYFGRFSPSRSTAFS